MTLMWKWRHEAPPINVWQGGEGWINSWTLEIITHPAEFESFAVPLFSTQGITVHTQRHYLVCLRHYKLYCMAPYPLSSVLISTINVR